MKRLRIAIRGVVQGVGFRPHVHRLATQLQLAGWVANTSQGLSLEVEGEQDRLYCFLVMLQREPPARAHIQGLECSFLDPVGFREFTIRASSSDGGRITLVPPDIATCADCVRDILDSGNRRYRYPFTNCTHCGPRFSIIESLPYDRPRTSMKRFTMCDACRAEYEDVADRRFHAQPIACAACGPQLEWWDGQGRCLSRGDSALVAAAERIRAGGLAAVKGLGGFQLLVDARNDDAVSRLRQRKFRHEKPLAVIYPSLAAAERDCRISPLERRLLQSPECPIVLIPLQTGHSIAPSVAPQNPYLGVMLPYTPLHHLLLGELQFPVVATSGNLAEEPICTDEWEAVERLGAIADALLVHDRPIVRHVDDSIVRVQLGRELILRRARGYAPLPLILPGRRPSSPPAEASPVPARHDGRPSPSPNLAPDMPALIELPIVLAVGGQLKNSVAVTVGGHVLVSQHLGDLENELTYAAFLRTIESFQRLYELEPQRVVADLHPDYRSTRYAAATGLPVMSVQHHFAHVVSCMAENELQGEVLGVAWDGAGYGPDGTVWGGEFLVTDGVQWRRVAALRRFRLPGGERAVREPRRSAVGVLQELFGKRLGEQYELPPLQSFADSELRLLQGMLRQGVNSPWTTSAGRLFDAVASLSGLRQLSSFEGQAAMELEFAAQESLDAAAPLSCPIRKLPAANTGASHAPLVEIDWGPLFEELVRCWRSQVPLARVAAGLHWALAESIVAVAREVGVRRVLLTGGCFQNRCLTECAVTRLESAGFQPYWHQRFPPNDGGLALGQAVAASWAGLGC